MERPLAARAQHLLDDVAHTAPTARILGDVARRFQNLGGGVGRCDGDADGAHTFQIGNVVAHEDDVAGVEAVFVEKFAQRRDLVGAVGVDLRDAEPLETLLQPLAAAARDDADLIPQLGGIGDGITVLGIVTADEVVAEGGDAPVGEYAVDVEDEGFGLYDILLEVSHMLCVISR